MQECCLFSTSKQYYYLKIRHIKQMSSLYMNAICKVFIKISIIEHIYFLWVFMFVGILNFCGSLLSSISTVNVNK